MSAKRTIGLTLAVLGFMGILVGSLVAGAAHPGSAGSGAVSLAVATGAVGLGWALAALGVVAGFAGLLLAANARGAFF